MNTHTLRGAAIAGALLVSTTLLAESSLRPNSQKYQDSRPNAKGRSGSASLEARALLNRDGSVDIDATTSIFDSASAPGTIARMQLDFETGATRNFNGLANGGSFTTNVQGLLRGDSVGLQANVRGIDGARTDVVGLRTDVRYRPDLTVSGITPAVAIHGEETTVRATIAELNGDTGARADCRLLVNGIQVDRAEGIWVDADGSVQCAFVTEFVTAGVASVTVVADNTNPGDWDASNNSATIQIAVQEPSESFDWWTMSARQEEFDTKQHAQRSWEEQNTHNSGLEQYFQFQAMLVDLEVSSAPMSMHIAGRTDGVTFFDRTSTEFSAPRTRRGRTCRRSESYPDVAVCRDEESGYTTIDVSFATVDAVYRSWGWATREHPWAPDGPRFEYNDVREHRGAVPFGNTLDFDVTFESGARRFAAQPFISSFTESVRVDKQPYTCGEDDPWVGGGTVCFSWESWRRARVGNASSF